jgi:hypothetical protein
MDNSETLKLFKAGCDGLDADVYPQLLNRSLIRDAKFKRLVKATDGDEYSTAHLMDDTALDGFQTIFLYTGESLPSDEVLKLGAVYKVV